MITHRLAAGPKNAVGLKLRSFRVAGGLEANIQLPRTYQAFPGIMNGGAIGALFDCHGNWTAAIALMDHSSLSKPPLTLTTEVQVQLKASIVCNGTPSCSLQHVADTL